MQVHDKRMWLVESHLYRRCTEEMMERWLKAMMAQSLDALSRFLPDRKFTKALIRGPRGELTATVSERERESRDLPAKEWGHAELQFTAAPGTYKDGIRGWSVHSTDIACLSKEDIRRYLYEQAVAAAVHLSGSTGNPSCPSCPGDIKEDGRGTLYANVTCQGLEDLGDLALDADGGRKFTFTAKPYGYDSLRFPTGRLTADLRRLMEEEPALPVVIRTEEQEETAGPCFCSHRCARVTKMLDYDYIGDGTVITEREHLERCIEADLTDLGKEGEEFDRLFDEELARMEPYWTKAIVVGPEDD